MNSPVRHQPSAQHSRPLAPPLRALEAVSLDLSAVIFAVRAHEPVVAVVRSSGADGAAGSHGALPGGPYRPSEHDTLQMGLRAYVERDTGLALTPARPLCTFEERGGRTGAAPPACELPVVSLCYLSLVGPAPASERTGERDRAMWHSWYAYFPWEDWRQGKPDCLAHDIEPYLAAWAQEPPAHGQARALLDRTQRVRIAFGCEGAAWDEEKVLDRYDLLAESGLCRQACRSLQRQRPHPSRTLFGALPPAVGRTHAPARFRHR